MDRRRRPANPSERTTCYREQWNQIVLHLPGRTPLDVRKHWRELSAVPKLSNGR
jgi:hypothetical protein